jgi:hypothetical protein
VDPQQVDPGNSARRSHGAASGFKGDGSHTPPGVSAPAAGCTFSGPRATTGSVGGQKPGWEGDPSQDSLLRFGSYSPPMVDTSRGRGRSRRGAPAPGAPRPFRTPRHCLVSAR